MKIDFLRSKEKKKIIEELNDNFGIEDFHYLLISSGKERIYGFSGSLSKEEIFELSEVANIELIGLYLFNKSGEDLRLSFDSTQLLGNKITKGTLEIDEQNIKYWMKGEDLEIKAPKGVFIINQGEDFLGFAKSNGDKIFNYVPKERRAKK